MPRRRLSNARVLIYSHDTFGLGHLRRCRAIAHELVARFKGISVLILSGSPVIASFEFRARVDYLRIPGVIKLKDGSYTSLRSHIDLNQTMTMRESLIQQTAKTFAPDLFLVDKEPLGLEGEVGATLKMLRQRGTRTVLGLRDVLDDPTALRAEWRRKSALPAVENLYDEIWIYGTEKFYHPLQGLPLTPRTARKTTFTGYLKRPPLQDPLPDHIKRPYILISPGGGKDGVEMVDLTLRALQTAKKTATSPAPAAVFVLGPFMDKTKRAHFKQRAANQPDITVLDYHPRLESLIENSQGIIAMGGYNTFCEILSFDKPAIILPRHQPRAEQLIRARRATDLNLLTMLEPRDTTPENLLPLLQNLPHQPPPSQNLPPKMLQGMHRVCERVVAILNPDSAKSATAA